MDRQKQRDRAAAHMETIARDVARMAKTIEERAGMMRNPSPLWTEEQLIRSTITDLTRNIAGIARVDDLVSMLVDILATDAKATTPNT
jgi:hypothetical protein